MLTAGIIEVSTACPIFDGTKYPYWKNRMRMHLEAIDVDLWYVVKNGVSKTIISGKLNKWHGMDDESGSLEILRTKDWLKLKSSRLFILHFSDPRSH